MLDRANNPACFSAIVPRPEFPDELIQMNVGGVCHVDPDRVTVFLDATEPVEHLVRQLVAPLFPEQTLCLLPLCGQPLAVHFEHHTVPKKWTLAVPPRLSSPPVG
eukprot:m.104818 g.104818  ORF g.104818 m.104818 type:complete len:105 (-) comp12619_c0_seq1:260-574(-)